MPKKPLFDPLLSTLRRRAQRLQQVINGLPTRTLWISWVLFVLVAGCSLAGLLLFSWKRPANYLSIKAIHVPAYVLPPSSTAQDSIRRAALLHHLQHLLYQVDSLRTHANTQYLYDSLVRQYPGLWDTLVQEQNFFLHPFTITP